MKNSNFIVYINKKKVIVCDLFPLVTFWDYFLWYFALCDFVP